MCKQGVGDCGEILIPRDTVAFGVLITLSQTFLLQLICFQALAILDTRE